MDSNGLLARLVRASLAHPFMVLLLATAVFVAGMWSLGKVRVDALPDLTDPQVIVYANYAGQAPQVVEDQVTYPVATSLLAVPGAKTVRAYSFFGVSFVYVLFDDGTDVYWARARVLESLSTLTESLPRGVEPRLGPDATGVGWALMYALNSDERSLADLRSLQDWYLRYPLTAVEGVSEVATVGGFVKQYQVELDPLQLRSLKLSVQDVRRVIEDAGRDVGGNVLEVGERELMIRGLGQVREIDDLRQLVVRRSEAGLPIVLDQIARITEGPAPRRGLAEWNGEGETVAGIVVLRADADTRRTLTRVKAEIARLQKSLPDDVKIEIAYDRSELIDDAIGTLKHTLWVESAIVALICALFLLHLRSALVAIVSIPLSVLVAMAMIALHGEGMNVMSLGGIAISIGVLVDAAVVVVENVHKHRERDEPGLSQRELVTRAAVEVAPSLFFSLLVLTVSFLPVFALEAEEGRLFRPLAMTKTYSMAASALVAVTVIPVLAFFLVRGRMLPESKNPIAMGLRFVYDGFLRVALRVRWLVLVVATLIVFSMLIPMQRMGKEFMPAMWEGDLLYMPTTLPGVSIGKAKQLLQQTDRIIAQFPEVEAVLGKVGRADTATDPAPLSMIETTIRLRDESEWRPGMTRQKLIRELDEAIPFPGLTNSWTRPIRTRIDMLSTGIRTPVGIKVAGTDLQQLDRVAKDIEAVVRDVPGTRSAYAERVLGGTYLDYEIDRAEAARLGVKISDIEQTIQIAIGGAQVGTALVGRERYPISLRYLRAYRDSPNDLDDVLVTSSEGATVALGRVAKAVVRDGPAVIKSENAQPQAWIFVDLETEDIGSWIEAAQASVAERVDLPGTVNLAWSGQFESMQRVERRLKFLVPLTLLAITLLLYMGTRSWIKVAIVALAVPFSLVGAVWLVDLLGYNWSVAVWVGLIALAGLDAETGMVMLLYLDLALNRARREGKLRSRSDLIIAVRAGAADRLRPKLMTITTTFLALVPILWASGIGSEVMRRIAAPMIGGVVTSFIGELCVTPVLYFLWKSSRWGGAIEEPAAA